MATTPNAAAAATVVGVPPGVVAPPATVVGVVPAVGAVQVSGIDNKYELAKLHTNFQIMVSKDTMIKRKKKGKNNENH